MFFRASLCQFLLWSALIWFSLHGQMPSASLWSMHTIIYVCPEFVLTYPASLLHPWFFFLWIQIVLLVRPRFSFQVEEGVIAVVKLLKLFYLFHTNVLNSHVSVEWVCASDVTRVVLDFSIGWLVFVFHYVSILRLVDFVTLVGGTCKRLSIWVGAHPPAELNRVQLCSQRHDRDYLAYV